MRWRNPFGANEKNDVGYMAVRDGGLHPAV